MPAPTRSNRAHYTILELGSIFLLLLLLLGRIWKGYYNIINFISREPGGEILWWELLLEKTCAL